ncbi:MAG TPA: DUF4331 domain-containing protein [Nocardioidaceae bacterium]|nr:DUF4331 domain-containing protein [Nocardioidaceae bacterium]
MLASGSLLVASGLALLGPTGATASSHREAPMIAGLPQYDNADVYAFMSPDKPSKVTLVANWIPLEEPAGGPNFYPWATDARYDINIDNTGDAKADIIYRWRFKNHYRTKNTILYNTGVVTSFGDPDLNFRQTYTLRRLDHGKWKTMARNAPVAPSYVGDASMPNYADLRDDAVISAGYGSKRLKSFVGQAEDPFFLDLRVFDLLYGGDLSEVGDDTLAGFNVNTIAMQIDRKAVAKQYRRYRPIIGVWSTTDRRGADGRFRQVSRLGNPLVNEVVIPIKDKDTFNASRPVNDEQFLPYVTNPGLPNVIEALYGIPAPEPPRDDLVQVFLTGIPGLNQPRNVEPSEQLRLNVKIPPTDDPDRLGVLAGDTAGFPNGRRLTDDVVDIELQVLEGELVGNPNDLGDAVNSNDVEFGETFPYVALPTSGSNPDPHDTPSGFTPLNGGAAPDQPTAGPVGEPVLVGSVLGLGLLLLLAGAVAASRRRTPALA